MCCGEPAPAQTIGCPSSVRSRRTVLTRERANGATAPGVKPVARSTSIPRATRAEPAPTARATFSVSHRRSPGTSATTAPESQTRTIDFTIWLSSQPTAAAASAAVGVPSLNSSIRASAPASRRKEETRSTGSGQADTSADYPCRLAMRLDAATPSAEVDEARFGEACSQDAVDEIGRRGRVDRERHECLSALRLAGDGHVGDVDTCFPEHRPDAADHARHVLVAEERHVRRELDVDRVPERAGEEEAVLRPDGRARDLDLLAVRRDHDADEVDVALGRTEALLRDLEAALGGDDGRVHVVDGLVDAALEDPV